MLFRPSVTCASKVVNCASAVPLSLNAERKNRTGKRLPNLNVWSTRRLSRMVIATMKMMVLRLRETLEMPSVVRTRKMRITRRGRLAAWKRNESRKGVLMS